MELLQVNAKGGLKIKTVNDNIETTMKLGNITPAIQQKWSDMQTDYRDYLTSIYPEDELKQIIKYSAISGYSVNPIKREISFNIGLKIGSIFIENGKSEKYIIPSTKPSIEDDQSLFPNLEALHFLDFLWDFYNNHLVFQQLISDYIIITFDENEQTEIKYRETVSSKQLNPRTIILPNDKESVEGETYYIDEQSGEVKLLGEGEEGIEDMIYQTEED